MGVGLNTIEHHGGPTYGSHVVLKLEVLRGPERVPAPPNEDKDKQNEDK